MIVVPVSPKAHIVKVFQQPCAEGNGLYIYYSRDGITYQDG